MDNQTPQSRTAVAVATNARIRFRAFCLALVTWLLILAVHQTLSAATLATFNPAPQQDSAEQSDDRNTNAEEEADDKKSEDESDEQQKDQQPSAEDESDEDESDEDSADETPKANENHDEEVRQNRRRNREAKYLQFAKFNSHLKDLLRDQVRIAAESTVEVFVDSNEEPSAMGTIVEKDGFVITKASSLNGRVSCRLSSGRSVPAIVYGIDPATDLALLRLQATNLPAIQWSLQSEKEAQEGYWVLSPDANGGLLSVGVVSVGARKIPPVTGFIGITMGEDKLGVPVTMVVPGSAAERFGLQISDVITKVENMDVGKREDIQAILRTKRPGDVVSLNIKRGEVDLALRIVLGNREEDSPEAQRAITQNTMSGDISGRRNDFPLAFQHDSVLDPQDCGGPIVDLDGRIIGINIARSGRVKSYALPMSIVSDVFERLSTGKFSPEIVFADQVEGFDTILESLKEEVQEIANQKVELDQQYDQQAETMNATRKELEDLKAQQKELEAKLAQTQKRLDSEKIQHSQIRSQVRNKERELEKAKSHEKEVEEQRKQLLFGAN